jgi:pro-apoptotic serine protease NMA111
MERSPDTRSKRKLGPVANHNRPNKQLKPEMSVFVSGDDATPNEQLSIASEEDDGRLMTLAAATADTVEWQATIERVVRNVVSIHFCQTCSFDTDPACSSEATGFVVDAKRGYILTNRHVVCAGPFSGFCIFDNHEEVRAPLS